MAQYADSVTLAVPSTDALALCRQAVEALGWTSQTLQLGGFRCTTGSPKAVTVDVSVTEAGGGTLVTLNAEKRLAIQLFVGPHLRGCVEKLKQKVTELAGARPSPGGSVPTGASTASGSAPSPEDRADFTTSQIDREPRPESGTLPMRDRQREGSGGLTGGGYNPTEDIVKQAMTALMKALSQAMGKHPPPPMGRKTHLGYLRQVEDDADAGKITLTPQVRDELAAARAALQKDLINHPDD